MARTTNELTKITLVASDMSYAADDPGIGFVGSPLQGYRDTQNFNIPVPFSIPSGYVVDRLFDDRNTTRTGFKAIAFRGQNDVIIAFAGTDGGNLQDWKENLKFGWSQWINNRNDVFQYLDALRAPNGVDSFAGNIHFTGQSLGGGLAEYAAYECLARAESQVAIDALKGRITVTTFNGFGGAAILAQERGDFNPDMLANLSESAAYYVANDIVSRLGVGHVGIQEYLLDYRSASANPATGLKYYLDPFDAHRIEPGFYDSYSPVLGFDESINLRSSKIFVPALQQAAALWAGIFSDKTNAPGDAKWRLPAGIIGGTLIAPTGEVQELSREVVAAFDRAGVFDARPGDTLIEAAKRKLTSILAVSAANIAIELSRPSMHKTVAGLFAVALGADANGRAAIADGFKKVVGIDLALASVSDSELLMQSRIALAAIPGLADEDVDASEVFGSLDLDISTYTEKIFGGGANWLDETLKYLEGVGFQSHQTAGARVNFEAELVNYVQQEKDLLAGSGDIALQDKVMVALRDFEKNFAQALANTKADFSKKYILADASAFGATQFDFVAYDQYHDALEQAASNPEFSEIESLLEDALDIVESAGLTVDLEVERPTANPFDTPGFDPDAAPLPSAQVREGGIQRFTLSLPYGAGEGEQRIAITLDGPAASHVKLLAGAEEVVPQGGVYTVAVEEGSRELELSFWGALGITEPGLTEPGTLSVSATLVNEAGQATHLTHLEADVEFVVREDFVLEEPVAGVLTDANDVLLIATPLSGAHNDGAGGNDVMWGDNGPDRFLGGTGDDRLFGSFRAYQGNTDGDWLSGGAGADQLLGGEGDDILEGDAGSDIVLGDVGDDFLFAGSQADYATLFTVGGLDPTGDLVQGGAGKDLVVGAAGDDQLSGGNDADLIIGGAGSDEIRGDTEFVPTHFFHIIGSTFPPQQPLAGGADILYGNAGLDTLLGEAGDDLLYGGEGGDTLIGGEGQDELYGGAGDDFLVGDADSVDPLIHTADFLKGGAGNDYLRGQGGSDTLIGDAGEDRLDGGAEPDLYLFNRGDGVDTIFDEGSNTIRFGPGIDADDLELGLGSLYIRIGDSGDAIRIENFNPDDVLGSYAIDSFEFFDGRRLSYAQLIARGFNLAGTEEDDAISGTNLADQILGGGGNDWLDGRAGADTLNGGPGDDVYVVDEPGDLIHEAPDEGNDTVESSAVSYVLGPNLENLVLTQKENRPDDDDESDEGEEGGQVVITGGIAGTGNELDNQIFGNVLDNVLDGRAGNDFLAGDYGSDIYRFGRGSGTDTVVEFDDAPGNLDSVQFAPDLAPAEVAILREANDLILAIRNSTDRLRLLNWFASDAEKVEQASFSDGTVWDGATLGAMASEQNSAPVISVPLADQTAQEDAAFAFTVPADTFSDSGNTLSITAARADGAPLPGWLSFDAALQRFSGTPANNDVSAFDVVVTASDAGSLSASDTFNLAVENVNDAPEVIAPLFDQLGNQNAPFSFQVPEGTFTDVDAGDSLNLSAMLADGSVLPAWLAFDAVSGTFSGTPSEFDVGDVDIRVITTDNSGASASDLFTLSVSDASTENATHLGTRRGDDIETGFTNDLIDAGRGNDIVHAGAGRDIVFGGPGEDFLNGEAGNDRLYGGKGEDQLYGGLGHDLLYGGRGGDKLEGGAGDDLLSGGAGHDYLTGGGGENLLIGGAGHDTITGGPGAEVFLVNPGDGHDELYLAGAVPEGDRDALSLGGGIGAIDISLKRDRGDLIVDARGPDEHASVVLKDWYRDAGDHQTVSTLQLFDGGTAVTYDFKELVARFDAETQGRHPTSRWSAAQALPAVQLTSGAEPLGGDIAREYAMSGTVLGDEPLADEDAEERAALPGGDWDPLPASNNAHPLGSNSKHESDRGKHRSTGKRESLADLLEAYLGQKPHYDFEALARELEPSDRHGEALNAHEIARRWEVVGRYAGALANEHDEDARGGADHRFNDHGLLGGGAFGGGFGYSGSTGALHRVADLQTLQGLDEGFQRLHV